LFGVGRQQWCCLIQSRCRHLVRHDSKNNYLNNTCTSKNEHNKYIVIFFKMSIRIGCLVKGKAAVIAETIWGRETFSSEVRPYIEINYSIKNLHVNKTKE
jgi:hypothetical protein